MTPSTDIETILKSLTLEEKISLLAGKNFWETVSIPGKGVPSLKVSDGPNGARGGDFAGGTSAACFPAASCVAATFDIAAANRIGQALAEETYSKGARCLLAPTTCIHRHPLGGRNFESFSEDPLLSGKMASQVIQGLQSKGVAATIKHFAANEQEQDRMTVNETISERALREIYLKPFEIAIKEAKPWAIMTAYNCVNGDHCDSSEFLLKEVLRGDWGWDGLVMSDWGGTNSTAESLNAGLDLEMPGPTMRRQVADVVAAVKAGKVSEATIEDRARAVLRFLEQLRIFEDPITPPEQAINKPEHQALIREVGAHGAVLLKNEGGVLPLSKEKVKGKKVAIMGLAKTPLAHGGGSASVNAHYKIAPWDAMQAAIGDVAELSFALGAHTLRILQPITNNGATGKVVDLEGDPGFTMKSYNKETGALEATFQAQESSALSPVLQNVQLGRIVEFIGDFTPKETGSHYMGCTGLGPTQVFIDDKMIWEQQDACSDAMGFIFGAVHEDEFTFPFTAGTTYRVKIRTIPPVNAKGLELLNNLPGMRLGLQLASDHDADLLAEATALAKEADYVVVFTGRDPQWETEGQDQVAFELPRNGSQDALVSALAAVNKSVVVVNSTGSAIALPWLDDVAGLVQSWFAGQECGNAIVDVLTGVVNPEGRLPMSFPKKLEDSPAYGNFPGEYVNGQLQVTYSEGVFVGYRHFDRYGKDKITFPFGYGMSYTTFETGNMNVASKSEDEFEVSVVVKNTGAIAGGTLVQVYAGLSKETEEHPIKSLVGFQKVRLQPGETQNIAIAVSARDLAYFDEKSRKWVISAGDYTFLLADSSVDITERVVVSLQEKTYAP